MLERISDYLEKHWSLDALLCVAILSVIQDVQNWGEPHFEQQRFGVVTVVIGVVSLIGTFMHAWEHSEHPLKNGLLSFLLVSISIEFGFYYLDSTTVNGPIWELNSLLWLLVTFMLRTNRPNFLATLPVENHLHDNL